MADIAQIGFKADTTDLDKAAAKLDALTPAANKAQTASSKVMKGFGSLNSSADTLTNAINGLNANIVKLISNSEKEAAAVSKVAAANLKKASSAKAAAAATNQQAAASSKLAAAAGGNGSGGRGTGGGNVIPIRGGAGSTGFSTANIAAQFQDIGVTAAMGMNPLQIALQQGTQLSAVLATMESPLKGIAAGLRSVLTATSLLTIGIIAIVAALLQMVNWTKVAKTVLNALADAVEVATPYVLGLVAALTLIYSRTIIVGISAVIVNIATLGFTALAAGSQMLAAWLLALGPIGLLIAGIAAVTAALIAFRDEVAQVLGVDLVKYLKAGTNFLVGSFVGAYNSIVAVWGQLPAAMGDVAIQAANAAIKGIEAMINASISAINGLIDNLPDWIKGEGNVIAWQADLGQFENQFAGAAANAADAVDKELTAAMNKDYVGILGDNIEQGISSVAGKLRKLSAGLGTGTDGKGGKSQAEKFDDIINGANRKIAALEAERAALGLSEIAAARLKYQTELLNEAQQKNIDLTPMQTQQLMGLANQMAALEVETKNTREAIEFSKSTIKGFFTDMREGLRNGQSVWEAFGNAVNKILDKITDKLLDEVLDAIFQVGGASGGGGGGSSFLSGIGSLIGSFFADGGAFNQNGVSNFAKGGAFTNNVVGKPTLFSFAKGGALGQMGEAGPEAIMPLKRGADGSLGVQMYGQQQSNGGGGVAVNINIINNSKAQVTSKQTRNENSMNIDIALDEAMAQHIARPGSKTNQALKNQQGRQLTKR